MVESPGGLWGSPKTQVPREGPFLAIAFATCLPWGAAVPTGLAQQKARLKLSLFLCGIPQTSHQPRYLLDSLCSCLHLPFFWPLGLEVIVRPICAAPCDIPSLSPLQCHNDKHKILAPQQTALMSLSEARSPQSFIQGGRLLCEAVSWLRRGLLRPEGVVWDSLSSPGYQCWLPRCWGGALESSSRGLTSVGFPCGTWG